MRDGHRFRSRMSVASAYGQVRSCDEACRERDHRRGDKGRPRSGQTVRRRFAAGRQRRAKISMSINLVELKQRVALSVDLFSTKERDLMLASLDVFTSLTEG